MPSPIEQRVEKLLAIAQRQGMVVERVLVEGRRIELFCAGDGEPRSDADLIDWNKARRQK